MRLNKTDQRILKLFRKGLTLKRITQRIGRPGDFDRVIKALQRAEIPEELWRNE